MTSVSNFRTSLRRHNVNVITRQRRAQYFREKTHRQNVQSRLQRIPLTCNVMPSKSGPSLGFDKIKAMFKQLANLMIWAWIFAVSNSFAWRILCTNRYSCLEIRYVKLSEAMFKSWGPRAVWTWVLIWRYLKWTLICLSDITRKVLLPGLRFTSTFLYETTLHGWRYDDRKFNADAILFGENQCKKKKAFQVLSCVFGLLLFEIR